MKKLIILALVLPVFCWAQKDSSNAMPKWNVYLLAHTNPHYFELIVPDYVEKKISPISFGGGVERSFLSLKKSFRISIAIETAISEESINVYANPNNKIFIDTNNTEFYLYREYKSLLFGIATKLNKDIFFESIRVSFYLRPLFGFRGILSSQTNLYFDTEKTISETLEYNFKSTLKPYLNLQLGSMIVLNKFGVSFSVSSLDSGIFFPYETPISYYLGIHKFF